VHCQVVVDRGDHVDRVDTGSLTAPTPGWQVLPVRWEERLLEVFDDLEQQAEGLALLARDAAAGERARELYSEVDLASRLHGSVGAAVELAVPGAGPVRGRLVRTGRGWCLLATEDGTGIEVIVNLDGLLGVRGLAPRAAVERTRAVTTRLGLASALRGVAAEQEPVAVLRRDGEVRRGRVTRVGADFVELLGESGATEVLPMAAVALVRQA